MFSKLTIFSKFTILATFTFGLLAVFIIIASNLFIHNSFISRSKLAVSKAIQLESNDLVPGDFSLQDPDHARLIFSSFYDKIRSAEIIRIKVWDYSAKVIFSDDESIIGTRYPDNDEFKKALKGEVISELGEKTKPENISETGYEQLLEVYVPVTFAGETVPSGVIEAYFKLDEVNNRIKETQFILLITTVTFTLTSYGLILLIFLKVISKQVEKIRQQATAIDHASEQIIITDAEGIIIYANKSAEKLTGYSKSEMIGNRPSLWGKQMPKAYYKKMWDTLKLHKKNFSGEITNKRKNGTKYEAEISISPVLDDNNKLSCFVGIERDITRDKEIDKAKTEFVSLASHQLRTPLSTINWYSEMLLAGDAGALNTQQTKYLDQIVVSNKRMVNLVNALLHVSRLELGTFMVEPEPTDIIKIAKSCIEELKPQIVAKNLIISEKYATDIGSIPADQKLLRIVFGNILSNSIKYTPDKGTISLSIQKNRNKELAIQISDSGYGIPKNQHDKIFTKLFRADNVRQKDTDGTGLGLYIVKSIIDHSGGKIWFESEENKGTTFNFILPLSGMMKKEGTAQLAFQND